MKFTGGEGCLLRTLHGELACGAWSWNVELRSFGQPMDAFVGAARRASDLLASSALEKGLAVGPFWLDELGRVAHRR